MPVLLVGGVDLVAVVVALAALIAVLALWVLFRPVTWTLEQAPFPVDAVGTAINTGLKAAMQFFIHLLDSIAHGIAHLFFMLGTGVWHLLDALINTIADAKTWAVRAYQLAEHNLIEAEQYADGLAANAVAFAASEAGTVLRDAEGLFNRAETDAAAALATADVAIGTAIESVKHEAEHLYNVAVADIAAAETDAVNTAEALFGDAVAHADHLYNQAVAAIAAAETDAVNTAEALFQTAEQDIARVAALAGGVALVAEVAQILIRVGVLEAEATTCLEPLCDTVTPNARQLGNLGNLLKGVDGIFDAALLGALLVASVEDPAGTARAVVDTTGWLTTLGVDLADAAGLVL